MSYYPEPNYHTRKRKVGLDLSYYATKAELKGVAGVDTSNKASKANLASLKAQVDNIDIKKLKTVPPAVS